MLNFNKRLGFNKKIILSALVVTLVAVFSILLLNKNSALPTLNTQSHWYQDGQEAVLSASRKVINNTPGAAKNIILFVGDGMSMTTVTAARIFAGQQANQSGEEFSLSFEHFPWTGLSKTYNTNQQIPDSAGTMTAMMTGIKTKAGLIGIDDQSERANCESYLNSDNPDLMTTLELAEIAGKATGIVSTARLTHATPAAVYAKTPERDWESSTTPDEEDRINDCIDIASQLINFSEHLRNTLDIKDPSASEIDGIDVAFGGGRAMFFDDDPDTLVGFSESVDEGRRKDGRNLIREWINQGGTYVMDQTSFDNLTDQNNGNVLGLFNPSHMRFEADRHNDTAGEPSLSEMTLKAIDLLEEDEDGFFLMVEGGRIDHAHHDNNAYSALNETVEFSNAVAAAYAATNPDETLIIVTADHSHVMTMAGYTTRGNPILGKVFSNDDAGNPETDAKLDRQDMPYTTLNYINGRGFADYADRADGKYEKIELEEGQEPPPFPRRVDLNNVNTETPGFHQESFIPLIEETHSGEDVPIYAIGPGSHLLSGSIEQNVIFHVMNFAGNLEQLAKNALK
ncbi:MAG: alkaline phosphatase [SAR86 cluster bacterium]|uniref:Alkaline phosphatase n=1 Tax=SAR86 cluster bacterium TaxID=2030880 RepID=A0A2A5CG52_9GAMM|nr:alkaline phosphatase [Gammaproteobacteria bacterium AH-315-E17]PCJ42498.1 MAG: alkaline phosphatase [SAR86 cluster bacterium]